MVSAKFSSYSTPPTVNPWPESLPSILCSLCCERFYLNQVGGEVHFELCILLNSSLSAGELEYARCPSTRDKWQDSMLCISGFAIATNQGQTATVRWVLCLKQQCL